MSAKFRLLYRSIGVLVLWALATVGGWSQEWSKVKSVQLLSPVATVSLDRYGLFYIADEDGNILKYDTLGVLQITYSPSRKADVTILEAWRNINIFVFYRNLQEFILLDRFLSPSPNVRVATKDVGFARLATFSYDNNIWLIDETDFSLKKYSLSHNSVDLYTPLDLILDASLYDLNFIKEYQNLLFVNDKNSGVLVFDNLGNYKTKIPVTNLSWIGFYNDEIYFQKGGNLQFINIYSYQERFEALPIEENFKFILYSGRNLYLFKPMSVEVYRR